MENFESMNFGF